MPTKYDDEVLKHVAKVGGVCLPGRHGVCFLMDLSTQTASKEKPVLWTIFVILLVLWALGLVSSYTIGGYIHLLLVVALVILLINIIQGNRSVV